MSSQNHHDDHLGTTRLRHAETNELILIPQPTNHPSDPLTWPRPFRLYLVVLVCFAVVFCNWLAAGPSVAIVATVMDIFGASPSSPEFPKYLSKVSFFFTTTSLCQGVGLLFWMPIMLRYGRRIVYITSFTLYTATAFWCAFAKSYESILAGRIIMGIASGAGEALGPLTIIDIFFLHERGAIMSMYGTALSWGVAGGIVIDGLITINYNWRYIYYIGAALVGGLTLIVIFTFPETEFKRAEMARLDIDSSVKTGAFTGELPQIGGQDGGKGQQVADIPEIECLENLESGDRTEQKSQKSAIIESLWNFNQVYTREPLLKLFIRPFIFILLPTVFWAAMVWGCTIGSLVVISSNFATAFQATYGFASWQSGLCFISPIIGAGFGIFFGGYLSDWIADYLTKRNNGIREPEMRLPAILVGGIIGPLGLILYGVGIGKQLHWIVPTIGLGCLNFGVVQAPNVAIVYCIDSYRPAAGELTVSILGFKAAIGFLISFYVNPWIDRQGYIRTFSELLVIVVTIDAIFGMVFFFYGKRIRQASWKWKLLQKYGHWHSDREVGE